MGIALDQFWRSNHYEHPPLTDEMVAEAQRQLGVKLPAEYLALLRVQNGGYTYGFGFPMSRPTAWAEDHVPLHDLFGIVTDPDHRTAQNILDTAYMTQEWGLPPRQVLLTGDGHWWITLDLPGRRRAVGRVAVCRSRPGLPGGSVVCDVPGRVAAGLGICQRRRRRTRRCT
ncbi:MAG TPA: SMI1/KNR4 family protein [Gemmata sp.]